MFKGLISKIKKILSTKAGKISTLFLLIFLGLYFNFCETAIKKNSLSKKVFLIAHDPVFYPLNLMGRDKSFVAFASDLFYEIARKQNIRIQLISIPQNALFEKLERGDYDAIVTLISPLASYRQRYLLSSSFYEVGPVLVSKNLKSPISIEEIRTKIIGVRRNSLDAFYFEPLGILMQPYDTLTIAFDDLERGRIDAIMIPYLQANTYSQLFSSGRYNIITTPLTDEGLRIVAPKNESNQFLIHEFNKGLKEAKASGIYDALLKKWGLSNPITLEESINLEVVP